MTDTATPAAPPKTGRKLLILGALLAVLGGAGGFYATFSGLILGAGTTASAEFTDRSSPIGTFVRIEPITVNMPSVSGPRHLRFGAQLEVTPAHAAEVARLMPRILDVLNTYLRALDSHELEEPAALLRLRAQMLRRIQIVTGPGRVSDILITEFIFT